jgi:hypothetical protein
MCGPSLPTKDGRRRKTYLIAILDDATRVIVHAEFYFEQHLRSLKDCLKQAAQPQRLPQASDAQARRAAPLLLRQRPDLP